ncbi:selenium-dependent xanthine dehydrogenase [Veillonella caviae]|uniref:selenium-dependent xanthine dehydrogenase n=2 Tax=Veillonella caviae TaxID=248316 RepID=UPI000F8E7AF7|nr:selenium-dependent xanthine dehydrogenase [Veillonella caviae]MCF0157312.1 selenium-dependent xanthine dehydrogenase [Veillonella sp.]MCI5708725.1 selenium-dependent xanthine dehydrogenase [Veillonella caviae]MCI7693951.1 selenium-dependent xanthine dehydrogenase [Veillonella caviae]MDD7291457.1 selenium-dependent xanthine dehydrogenase [Veillonella caviae]MDY4745896.1 selenium-dependent xanthine dehydrogenase [Veillonella caviae]
MYQFQVNGTYHQVLDDQRLIDYLRDTLGLRGTKEGCSGGACGTCTILIDGKKSKACVVTLSQLDGKKVTTIEGLSEREKSVYTYAFGECGAVQCGFCIPGMIISAKALIDENPNPTSADIKKAIMGNICRCTGYVKIEQGIALAAQMLRDNIPVPAADYTAAVGTPLHRIDVEDKVLGTGLYSDDFKVDGMVYAKAIRSKYPRARVDRIDINKALAHPQCITVLTACDVPFNKTGHLTPDWDVFIKEGHVTRYVGDAIALAVVKEKKYLDEVCNLIDVEYTELKPLLTPEEAMAPDAPLLHESGNILSYQTLSRGDVDKAIAESAFVVTNHYSTPQTDHAFMEPECAVAYRVGDILHLHSGSQNVFDDRREVARMLGIPDESVQVHSMLVGGGFGGKEDMSVQHHASLAAWITGLPVNVRFSRQESLLIHTKRHAMEMDITTACDEEGNLTASKVSIVSNCGAYASLGGPVLQRAGTHSSGPYHFENFAFDGVCVYTNTVPGGAFRGFGVTQTVFGQEQNIDELAALVGMDPWAFRYKNAVRPGEALPNGQICSEETGLVECLEAVKEAYYSSPRSGLAICMKNSGIGVGLPDIGRTTLEVQNGIVRIRTGAACIGQGVGTMATQILCETTGLTRDKVLVESPDTVRTPNSGTTTASRQTLFTGEATRLASVKLKELLETKSLDELNGTEITEEFLGVTDPFNSDKPHPKNHVAYGFGACVAIIGDDNKVSDLHVAYDVGRVINPQSCEGQAEGGAIMGMGYGVTEDFVYKDGYVMSKYGTLGLLRSTQCPKIHVSLIEKGTPDQYAYGAKGIGEISSIPIAPSIANAYRRIDGEPRRSLPLCHTGYRK